MTWGDVPLRTRARLGGSVARSRTCAGPPAGQARADDVGARAPTWRRYSVHFFRRGLRLREGNVVVSGGKGVDWPRKEVGAGVKSSNPSGSSRTSTSYKVFLGPAPLSLFLFGQPHFRSISEAAREPSDTTLSIPSSYPHTLTHCFPNHPPHATLLYISLPSILTDGQWKSTRHLLLTLVAHGSLIRPRLHSISLPTSGLSPILIRSFTSNMLTVLFKTPRGLRPPQTTKPCKRSR